MRRLLLIAALVVVLASPALAAGPYDGLWSVAESHPTLGVTSGFASVTENDVLGFQVYGFNVVVTLFRVGSGARIGVGILSGNVANGNFFDQNLAFLGTAHVTFTDLQHFTGTFSSPVNGVSTLVGQRAF